MSKTVQIRDALRQAFEEGYIQGAHHPKAFSVVGKAQELSEAFWNRVRDEANQRFASRRSTADRAP